MGQDPSEVRQAIEQNRLELAETVQALAQKADVKQRVRESVSKNSDQMQHKARDMMSRARAMTPNQMQSGLRATADSARERPFPLAVAAALLAGFLIGRRSGRGGRVSCS